MQNAGSSSKNTSSACEPPFARDDVSVKIELLANILIPACDDGESTRRVMAEATASRQNGSSTQIMIYGPCVTRCGRSRHAHAVRATRTLRLLQGRAHSPVRQCLTVLPACPDDAMRRNNFNNTGVGQSLGQLCGQEWPLLRRKTKWHKFFCQLVTFLFFLLAYSSTGRSQIDRQTDRAHLYLQAACLRILRCCRM